MAIITDSGCRGTIKALCVHSAASKDISSQAQESVKVTFEGIAGDTHKGLTRSSCVRVKKQYELGTTIRNTRQVSIVSEEELLQIAERMKIPDILPEWLGANICLVGIPDLTGLPPSTRLLFGSGASLVVDAENEPCKYPAEIIEQHYPGSGKLFVKNAIGVRGVTAWVEREGVLSLGELVAVHTPKLRQWACVGE